MKRLALLGAAGLIGLLPNIATAHSRFFAGFSVGIPFLGVGFGNYCYRPRYCGVSYYTPAPPVVCADPVVVSPSVAYTAPVYSCRAYYYAPLYHGRYYHGGASYFYYRR
jgi:hypothetical protein